MSDVEQRQTQQRAFSIAACAAVISVGGPVVGERAEIHRAHEAYVSKNTVLSASLADERSRYNVDVDSASAAPGSPWMRNIAFNLDLAPVELLKSTDLTFLERLSSNPARRARQASKVRSELDCLAEAVYYEARSENTRGQFAVAEVVINRVRDRNFPNTICGVVFEGQYRATGCQFTFTCDGSRRAKPRGAAWDRARAVALNVRLGLNKPITNKATHYHTDYVDPYWSPGLVKTATVGSHIFYRFPRSSSERVRAREAMAARQEIDATLVTLETQPGDIVITPTPAAAFDVIEPSNEISKSL